MMILPEADRFYAEVSELIKSERLKLKISQEELSDLLNLTRASIINLEKGRHKPSIYQILQIAAYFKIDYTNLIPVKLDRKESRIIDDSIVLDNAVSDQDGLDKPTEDLIKKFLSDIKNEEE